MAVTTKSFPVVVQSERKALAFDLRVAVVDWLRARIARKIDSAEDVGIDKQTAVQRFCLTYAGAAKASRLARGVPSGLVRWAAYAEFNKTLEWFPKAQQGTVGSFGKDALTILPNDAAMVQLGGIEFVGVLAGGVPEDLVEVRVSTHGTDGRPLASGYLATLVIGRPDSGQGEGLPVPVEGELQDA